MNIKPVIEGPPSILNRPDGSVLFEAMVMASPAPDVKWYFKDNEITPDDRHVMKMKKMVGKFAITMIIKNPNQHDQGTYKVVATNASGSSSQEQTYVAQCVGNSVYKMD